MKKIILSSASVLIAAASFSQTAQPSCPTISVSSGSYEYHAGDPAIFSANITGNDNVTFNWTVSAGSISSGQGTSSITVDTDLPANSSITATLEVGGLDRSCSNSSSSTISILEKTGPKKVKVKEKVKPKKKEKMRKA